MLSFDETVLMEDFIIEFVFPLRLFTIEDNVNVSYTLVGFLPF